MTLNEKPYAESSTWKELRSQAEVWQSVIAETRQSGLTAEILSRNSGTREWLFVGCGTSFYLAEAAALSWITLTGEPARAIPASEILLFPELLKVGASPKQAVVISRSGKTSEAVRAAAVLRQTLRIPTIGITCAQNSELERECDLTIVLRAADENSTVMTRSFTSMLVSLQVLAACRAGKTTFLSSLERMAVQFARQIQEIADRMRTFVEKHEFADYVFLGQGAFHGIAREAALKVMEMSCSYSQFFHALEFRHGPKAIVSPATCLTFFISETGETAEAEVLSEMKDLGGIIVAICNRANDEIRKSTDLLFELDLDADEIALLAPFVVPCQTMGFFTGLHKGLNPDQPKNLTRVVILG
ncbi:MAG TPA: SIS domain-containing protein [Dongiaceae bacterium]|nr:SIS domain-containing protein [Dongiaceae bacterium]